MILKICFCYFKNLLLPTFQHFQWNLHTSSTSLGHHRKALQSVHLKMSSINLPKHKILKRWKKNRNNSTNEKTPKGPNAILWYPSKVQINRVQVSYAQKINYMFASCFHVPICLSCVAMIHDTEKPGLVVKRGIINKTKQEWNRRHLKLQGFFFLVTDRTIWVAKMIMTW